MPKKRQGSVQGRLLFEDDIRRKETDDELVRLVQQHGKEAHDQEVSRQDALAMVQPAD